MYYKMVATRDAAVKWPRDDFALLAAVLLHRGPASQPL